MGWLHFIDEKLRLRRTLGLCQVTVRKPKRWDLNGTFQSHLQPSFLQCFSSEISGEGDTHIPSFHPHFGIEVQCQHTHGSFSCYLWFCPTQPWRVVQLWFLGGLYSLFSFSLLLSIRWLHELSQWQILLHLWQGHRLSHHQLCSVLQRSFLV